MPRFSLTRRKVIEPTPIDEDRYGTCERERKWAGFLIDLGVDPAAASWDAPDIKHLDGVEWSEARVPPRNHVCWPQTSGWLGLDEIQRCACGAIRRDGLGRDGWFERNSRKAS